MLLTIGMIVKNEEKYLERCLSGIKSILDNVDSELIITDTGSTDNTVEIAKKFTDKLLYFEWIKDFSAARNTAFDIASGEWFMFLDADEIFESCDGIIQFFNSGEYRNYKSASFVVRNLYNEKDYLDFFPRRMVRRYPDTKFVGMIHEYLYPILSPSKHIDDVALHYGYLYTSVEESQKKFKRNIELLLKTLEIEANPHPRIYSQLFDCYGSVFDFEKAFRYLELGIKKCKETKNGYIIVLYAQKADNLYLNQKYSEVYSVCEEYFEQKKLMNLSALTTDGEMYAYKADSLFALDRCDEAVDVYEKFFETYNNIKNGKLHTEDAHQITYAMCNDRTIPGLMNNFLACCINSSEYDVADKWLREYPLYKYSYDSQKLNSLIFYELIISKHLSFKNISYYYNQLDNSGKKRILDELFASLSDIEKRNIIFDALGSIAKNKNRISDKLDIYKSYYSGIIVNESITKYIEKYGILNNIDIIGIIFEKQYDISPVFTSSDFDLKQCAYLCCKNINGFYEIAEKYDFSSISNVDILPDAAKFYDYCIGMRLVENEGKSEEEKKRLIEQLLKIRTRINELYNKKNASFEFEQLATAIKHNIRAYLDAGNFDAARKTLEEYKKINPVDSEITEIDNLL